MTAKIWDARLPAVRACIRTFHGHIADVNKVAFLSSGTCIATASDDSMCRIFDLRSCGAIAVLEHAGVIDPALDVAFSRSGRLLFAAYEDGKVRAWDTTCSGAVGDAAKPFAELDGHGGQRVTSVGINAHANALASAGWNMEVAVWA